MNTLTLFFHPLYEEYFALWPPTPTEEDIETAKGKTEIAVAKVRKDEQKVSNFDLRTISVLMVMAISESIDGCTTELDRSTA